MPLDAHLVLGGYQYRACVCFFIALICCETTFGTTLQFLLLRVPGKWGLSATQSGLYPTAQSLGQMLGSLICGRLADVVGRRPVILASLTATVLGAALCSLVPEHDAWLGVPTYAYLMLALGLLGFGFGGSLSPLCILLAEVLPIQRRGFFLANSTVAFQIGSVLITAGAWYIMPRSEYANDDDGLGSASSAPPGDVFSLLGFSGWRLLYAMECAVAFVCLLFLCAILPESPRFLLLRGRAADLERLRHQLDMMLRMGGLKLQPSRGSTASQPLLSPEASDVGSVDELISALSAEISGAQDDSKGSEKWTAGRFVSKENSFLHFRHWKTKIFPVEIGGGSSSRGSLRGRRS